MTKLLNGGVVLRYIHDNIIVMGCVNKSYKPKSDPKRSNSPELDPGKVHDFSGA